MKPATCPALGPDCRFYDFVSGRKIKIINHSWSPVLRRVGFLRFEIAISHQKSAVGAELIADG